MIINMISVLCLWQLSRFLYCIRRRELWRTGDSTEHERACGRRSGSIASQLAVDGLATSKRRSYLWWKSYQQSVGRVGVSLRRRQRFSVMPLLDRYMIVRYYFLFKFHNDCHYIVSFPGHDTLDISSCLWIYYARSVGKGEINVAFVCPSVLSVLSVRLSVTWTYVWVHTELGNGVLMKHVNAKTSIIHMCFSVQVDYLLTAIPHFVFFNFTDAIPISTWLVFPVDPDSRRGSTTEPD